MKPLAASLLEALDYDSSDDSDFKVGDASGKYAFSSPRFRITHFWFMLAHLISYKRQNACIESAGTWSPLKGVT